MSAIATDVPQLEIRLDLTGEVLTAIEEWEIEEGYWESTDAWSATIATEKLRPRDLWMQPVTLILGGVPWMAGRIEVVSSDDVARSINISGRDYIADLVEGHVDPSFKLGEKTKLTDAILQACRPYGITKVLSTGDFPLRRVRSGSTARSAARKDLSTVSLDDLQPKDGQGAFDFCNRLAARCGCTIQPDIRRDTLVLAVPGYTSPPVYALRTTRDPAQSRGNNVLKARSARDGTHWPSVLRLTAGVEEKTGTVTEPGAPRTDGVQQTQAVASTRAVFGTMRRTYDTMTVAAAFNAALGAELAGKAVPGLRKASDGGPPLGKLYRLFRQEDREIRTVEQLHALGARILGERLKSTLSYSATVRGFADPSTGKLWTPDTIAQVDDEIRDVNEPLWIESVTKRFSRSRGATSALRMIRPGVRRVEEDA